ncbi:ABC transporter permease [Micromonospora profundi]|uniref:ABC transporter permease n=1 Tax=Micromonospora TaxID=1873 RepID=UPI00143C2C5D|nr:ABC transporter permease [Micromonospora profundi]NJC12923.1 putative ABC transport system permease protein [Micromonospora profundi]
MFGLAWANVTYRVSRLLLPGLAVALGVGFVSGTLMVTDTMRQVLLDQLSSTPATLSVVVERKTDDLAGSAKTVPAALLEQVGRIDGVAAARGQLWGPVAANGPDGRRLAASPNRSIVIGIADEPRLRDVTFVSGQAPSGPTDIALDSDTAVAQRIDVGQQLKVGGSGGGEERTYTVTGLIDVSDRRAEFGDSAVVGLLDSAAAAVLRATAYGRIEALAVAGLSQEQLRNRVAQQVGDQYSVRTGEAVRAQEASDAARDLDSFTNALMLFAGVSLLIAGIVAYNTFSVVVAQRLRETALLRCVGATRRQVFAGNLTESSVLGLLASVVGLIFGFGAALLMLRFFGGNDGIDTGGAPIQFEPRTAVVALLVGPLVATLAALVPTVRAARARPISALRDAATGPVRGAGRRRLVASVFATLALVLLAGGVVAARVADEPGRPPLYAVLAGALLLTAAVLIAAPLAIPRLGVLATRILGPLAGHPGRLAAENARRNPERTATTAAALCIGLTLVTVVSTIAAAATTSVESSFARNFPFAYTLRLDGANTGAAQVMTDLQGRSEVGAVVGVRGPSAATEVTVKGRELRMKGVDDTIGLAAPDAVAKGTLRGFGVGKVALDEALADQLKVTVGDRLDAKAAGGQADLQLTVVALLDNMSPLGPFAVAAGDLARVAPQVPVSAVQLTRAKGVTDAALQQAVTDAVAGHPEVTPVSSAQSVKQWSDAVGTLRSLLMSLLGLSVLISFFSVANALSLSIVERTRESALLRALGLTRRQLSRTLMAEGVFVVALGAAAGITLGVGFGWAVAAAMGWSAAAVFSFPGLQIAMFAVLAIVVGLGATLVPARRAARLPIVRSLARE